LNTGGVILGLIAMKWIIIINIVVVVVAAAAAVGGDCSGGGVMSHKGITHSMVTHSIVTHSIVTHPSIGGVDRRAEEAVSKGAIPRQVSKRRGKLVGSCGIDL